MKFRFAAVLGLALCCVACPANAASSGIGPLTAQAEALYQQAVAYVAHAPVTIAQTEGILDPHSPYMMFMAAEKRFEDGIGRAQQSGALPPPRQIEWIQVGVWVGSAVQAAGMYCNTSESRVDLSVARQYLDDARAGSPLFLAPNSTWQPAGFDEARKLYINQVQDCRR